MANEQQTPQAWGKSQKCFIEFLVSPKFEALAHVCDSELDKWTPQLAANRAFWESLNPLCCFDNLSSEVCKDYVFSRASGAL